MAKNNPDAGAVFSISAVSTATGVVGASQVTNVAQSFSWTPIAYKAKFYTDDKLDFELQSNSKFSSFKDQTNSILLINTIQHYYEQGYRPDGNTQRARKGTQMEVTKTYRRTTCLIIVQKEGRQIGGQIKGYLESSTAYAIEPYKLFSRLGFEKIEYNTGKYKLKQQDISTSPEIVVDDYNCLIKETNEHVHLKNVSVYDAKILQSEIVASVDKGQASAKTVTIHLQSNSPLVVYTKIIPNSNSRDDIIQKITPHHMAGTSTVEGCVAGWISSKDKVSSNYGIGTDGRVGLYVEESRQAYTSTDFSNDQQAVTIEVANSVKADPWPVSDLAYNKLIDLCVDICKRNGITELKYPDSKLSPDDLKEKYTQTNRELNTYGWSDNDKAAIRKYWRDNFTLTRHDMFSAQTCPGPYLGEKFPEIRDKVNKRLELYRTYF